MATCVSEFCRKQIPDAWAFCGYCGADNRPPGKQDSASCRRHKFIGPHACCIHCGEPPDEPYAFRKKVRLRLATALLIIGVLALAATGLIHGSHERNWPLTGWVDSWWYDPYTQYSGRHRRRYETQLGYAVILWGYTSAGIGISMGIALYFKFDFSQFRDRERDSW